MVAPRVSTSGAETQRATREPDLGLRAVVAVALRRIIVSAFTGTWPVITLAEMTICRLIKYMHDIEEEEKAMNCSRSLELPETREVYRSDEGFADALESSRKTGPLSGIKATESGAGTAEEVKETASASDLEQKQERWMESVKAFIRNIDIDDL
jgi:hypothetical protein